MSSQAPHVLILAAGKGKRMKSALPKVLHPVLGQPMLHHIIDTVTALSPETVGIVVGHGEDDVKKACTSYQGLTYFSQKQQLGTGDAVRITEDFYAGKEGSLLVLAGDVCLLTEQTLKDLVEHHVNHRAACTVATAVVGNPHGYGRILSQGNTIVGIREQADCSPEEAAIKEINSGIYCFQIRALFESLKQIKNNNRQGEFYLTDVLHVLAQAAKSVVRFQVPHAEEVTGINDRAALCEVENILRRRVIENWWKEGVTIQDPSTTIIDTKSKIAADVVIEGNVRIENSIIETGVVIESGNRIQNSKIRSGAHLKQGSYIESSEIGRDCSVGPYAHLRPESVLQANVKIGNFVEIKKSLFKEGSKASHLSYIGDAEIGKNSNLGCGFITCNYDGKKKSKTMIGDNVFVGSDSQTVAPVTIGEGSYIASGSTVTEDVPKDSLVISRGKQITKPGYAKKYRGFSLVELMIVVAIIGVLATIGVPTFRTMVAKAKKSEAKSSLGGLYTAEQAFFAEYGVYGNAVNKIGFELDGVALTRPYAVGFFNGNCQGFTTAIAPAQLSAGLSLNANFPGYYQGAEFGLQGKAFPTANAAGDAGCALASMDPGTSKTFTAGAAGMISTAPGASPDVWTINEGRQLSNIVDGAK